MIKWIRNFLPPWRTKPKITKEESADRIDQEQISASNTKQKIERELQTIGCPMSFEEFIKFIVPLLLRYPHTSVGYNTSDAELLYKFSGKDPSAKNDAYELLRWKHNDLILQTACMLRNNFELLMGAGVLGMDVTISTQENCCLSIFNGRTVNTLELISAYDNPDGEFPLFPPIETPCVYQDGAHRLCHVLITAVNNRQIHGDPDFAAYLDDHFGKARAIGNLPWIDNWRDVLVGERNKLLREQIIGISEDLKHHGDSLETLNLSIGTPPTAETLSRIGMKELRTLQKKYGIHGHRTMIDISKQLITFKPAQEEIQALADSIRIDDVNSHIEEAKRCFDHIKSLEETVNKSYS
ncbi:MAG TPA: hypothetical protein PKZ37_15010 [Gallionellaceae bacterium]|jgi:hypothetical protein|nr:hypothetical protein [Gallionellaceae bacterium]